MLCNQVEVNFNFRPNEESFIVILFALQKLDCLVVCLRVSGTGREADLSSFFKSLKLGLRRWQQQ